MTRQQERASDLVSRRTFVAAAGTASILGVAGCTENTDPGTDADGGDWYPDGSTIEVAFVFG